MTPRDLLAEAIEKCKPLAGRYLAGFSDADHTAQAAGLPNHVAWSLGHCALTMHRVAEMVDASAPPAADFGAAAPGRGDRPSGFGPETVAFGSRPLADPAAYPPLARCVEIYNSACDRLAAAAHTASDAKFNAVIKWGPVEAPWWTLAFRMIFHNGFHTGQIADLRRAFGFKSIMS